MQIKINSQKITFAELSAAFRSIGFELYHCGRDVIEASPIPEPLHRVIDRKQAVSIEASEEQ